MTLVLIGPACEDLIIIGDSEYSKVGGASLFQSFVYEEFYNDYLAIVNASNVNLIDEFPDKSKLRPILKEDTHYFINEYPDKNNLDIRKQSTNFANIPISVDDLRTIFEDDDLDAENIDAFVLAPLNSNDFPIQTLTYLKSFDVPIFISLQGFLRLEGEDDSMILKLSEDLKYVFEISDTIFLDEDEFDIIKSEKFYDSNLVVTNGSKGSRIIEINGESIKINAVKCNNIIDATGCGDTYMAAYISARLNNQTFKKSGDFASMIASRKLENFGPYKK
ncbi:PfkB family carbohydrate kinase [Methanobrevibacter sp.]|uniref:PfkB family carbohydrate kinase n=1 Tax=Methanobrevibacter sp. TaxID=66852 RepID=UPI0025FAA89E|nr:PfkB family carbohydrate kinase [Methanobrevibacter sp.]MBQ2962206.1 ribokinase [Methanobrevibacter sp.]